MTAAHASCRCPSSCRWPAAARFTELGIVARYRPASWPTDTPTAL